MLFNSMNFWHFLLWMLTTFCFNFWIHSRC